MSAGKILVVDDDPQIRDLLLEYLTENALRVTVSSTGQQMAAILDDQAIDLVILDLRLAGEDGMAIVRALRDTSAIPIIMLTGVRDEAEVGCVMSYGMSLAGLCRRAAILVDKILKGAMRAELPIEQPKTFEFVVNLKTAKALGVTISPSVLAIADEVIE